MQIAIPLGRNLFNQGFAATDFNGSRSPAHHDNRTDSSTSVSNSLDTANKILQQATLEHLNKQLPENASAPVTALSKQTLEHFAPDKVSDRIVNFVGSAINQAKARGATEEQLNHMMSQAQSGIDQGFAEAKEVLDKLGVLGGEIAENIDATYNAVQKGLDKLSTPTEPVHKKLQVQQLNLAEYRDYYNENSINMQITTKEGDIIQLHVNRTMANGESLEMARNDDSLSISASRYKQESFQMNYSIAGNLNEDEVAALESFMSEVNDIADDFFSGDLSSAFDEALNLEYDRTQLQSYSVNMRSVETSQYTKIYQETSRLGETDSPQRQDSQHTIKQSPQKINNPQQALDKLQQFVQQAQKQFLQSPITKHFNHSEKMGNELLQKLIASDDRNLRDLSSGDSFLEKLLPGLTS